MAGPTGTAGPGQVVTVPDEEADQLVEGGYASHVDGQKPAPEKPVAEGDIAGWTVEEGNLQLQYGKYAGETLQTIADAGDEKYLRYVIAISKESDVVKAKAKELLEELKAGPESTSAAGAEETTSVPDTKGKVKGKKTKRKS